MIAMKGKSVEVELEAARSKIEVEGLTLTVKKYRLPHLDIERCLIILPIPQTRSRPVNPCLDTLFPKQKSLY